jgi:GT2 family glycosyltransferase
MVSIVIQNYNGRVFLEKWLHSVLNVDYPNIEIVIVDDASTDGSLEFLYELSESDSRLRIIRNKERVGISAGRNIGIREARGKYLLFLDNDVKVDSKFISELVAAFESDLEIGAAQSKVLFLESPAIINSAGGFIDETGEVILRGLQETDAGKYDNISEIFFASGCALFSTRKVLLEAGLFDPRFVFWYDDVDICWRIRLMGYKIIFVPKSVVYHLSGGSVSTRTSRINAYLHLRNRLLMLISNYEESTLIKSGLMILLKTRKMYGMRSLMRGFLHVIFNFKEIWKLREQIQISLRKISDRDLKSLIIDAGSIRTNA